MTKNLWFEGSRFQNTITLSILVFPAWSLFPADHTSLLRSIRKAQQGFFQCLLCTAPSGVCGGAAEAVLGLQDFPRPCPSLPWNGAGVQGGSRIKRAGGLRRGRDFCSLQATGSSGREFCGVPGRTAEAWRGRQSFLFPGVGESLDPAAVHALRGQCAGGGNTSRMREALVKWAARTRQSQGGSVREEPGEVQRASGWCKQFEKL